MLGRLLSSYSGRVKFRSGQIQVGPFVALGCEADEMTESEASLQAGARTIGSLRLLVLFAVSIVPATVGIILSVVISGDLYADISENLARFVHIFTNVFLIAYPIFWGISGADETR